MSCCPAGSHGWHPGTGGKGGVVQVGGEGGLEVYVSGKQTTKEAVVDVYDIFGLDGGRTKGFADDLAEKGDFLVVVPDFFRGVPWDEKNFPPKNGFPELLEFLTKNVPWPKLKEDIFGKVLPWLKEQGVERIGIIGFCWGAKQVVQAIADPSFQAAVLLHPSFVGPDDVKTAECPILILNASNDPPTAPIKEVLDTKPFGASCSYKDYPEQMHGWTVRGDLTNPATARDAQDAFEQTVNFLKKHLKK